MRYAINEDNERIEVEFSGQRSKCAICKSEVVGKKGDIKKKHWAHKRNRDCDNWYEPITEWHIKWQNYFPEENREIILTDNGKSHRADIQLNNGMVIEVQNSPINHDNIISREEFYGKNNMIWILNGAALAKHSELTIKLYPFRYYFIIEFPKNLPNNPNYLTEIFFDRVTEIYGLNYLPEYQFTENKIIYTSIEDLEKRDQLELTQLKYYIVATYETIYGNLDIGKFQDNLKLYNKYKKIDLQKSNLKKKYWRYFIDKMKYPVFIDQLNGLKEDEIYWYQKNRIFKKEELLNKYLAHTKTGNNIG